MDIWHLFLFLICIFNLPCQVLDDPSEDNLYLGMYSYTEFYHCAVFLASAAVENSQIIFKSHSLVSVLPTSEANVTN